MSEETPETREGEPVGDAPLTRRLAGNPPPPAPEGRREAKDPPEGSSAPPYTRRPRHPVGDPEELGAPPPFASFLIAVFIIILVPTLVATGLFLAARAILGGGGAAPDDVLRTALTLRTIQDGLSRHFDRTGAYPAGSAADLSGALLSGADPAIPAEERAHVAIEDGVFVDGWGRPLCYASDGASAACWSIGPNGRDESGRGDDLVVREPQARR